MQNFDHNIGFWEKRQFFAENWEKSQKIVIITSTPGQVRHAPSILKSANAFEANNKIVTILNFQNRSLLKFKCTSFEFWNWIFFSF
jgi:hypothetical protein